jgi:predicted component of type VI protein secretion system
MKITITLSNGSKVVQETGLSCVVIGRSAQSNIIIPENILSRKHAQLEVKNGEYFITDLASSNGVYIDGKRIEPSTKTSFSTFQTLALGPIEFQITDSDNSSSDENMAPLLAVNQTRTVRIDSNTIKRSLRKSAPKNDLKANILPILLFAGIIGLIGYKMSNNTRREQAIAPAAKPVAGQIIARPQVQEPIQAPDEFLEKNIYRKDLAQTISKYVKT